MIPLTTGDGLSVANGNASDALIMKGATPAFVEPLIPSTAQFFLKDCFQENPAFGSGTSGTGAAVGTAVADATLPGLMSLGTGTTTTGRASRTFQVGANVWTFSTTSRTSTWKLMGWSMPTLSGATDTAAWRGGFIDLATGSAVDGAYLEFDANSNVNMLFVTSANSTRTSTASTFVPVAGTFYDFKIVVTTNTTVSFYARAAGAAGAAWTLLGTTTTNIPTGTTRGTGAGISLIKSAGTTNLTATYQTQVAYQE